MNVPLYNAGIRPGLNECDSIRIELRDATSPSTIIANADAEIYDDGTAMVTFPGTVTGNSYYIAIFQRNHFETWSKLPVYFSSPLTYDFTTASTQAYDDGFSLPMKEVQTGVWACYGGDVNQDGTADGVDMNSVDNDALVFAFGYNVSDVTGDGATDGLDMNIVDNNAAMFLFVAHP